MDLASVRIVSPDGSTTAEFIPGGGMLCHSLRHHGDELLSSGHGLDAYLEEGKTLGIPLLFPWANRLDGFEYRAGGREVALPHDRARFPVDPNGLPIHGAVPGLMRWDVDSGDGSSGRIAATLDWDASSVPELFELFPFEHEVQLDASVGDGSLTVATTVTAVGSDRVPVSFGFHPYLCVPGAGPRAAWRLQLPSLERLELDARNIPTGARSPMTRSEFELADSSWDDAFAALEVPARFAISTPSGRGIALELLEGFPFAQIYGPPGHDFVCLEPMTAPADALRSGDGLTVIEPGASYRAVFKVTAWR